MTTITITRGLPASGKTTWALAHQANVAFRAARVNRDDLRRSMHGPDRVGAGWAERQVSAAQRATVEALLRAGVDVICDDTNLRAHVVRGFAELARRCGAEFAVQDFTAVPVEVCVERDAARPEADRVGEAVIRGMWQRYLAARPLPLPLPHLDSPPEASPAIGRRYVPDPNRPEAVLVDIDGTVAVLGDRSPYDMARVGEDTPNHAVITAVRAMHAFGHRIVYCSGRSEDARARTEHWLAEHVGVPHEALYMRKSGDTRRDSVVKAEIFEREIQHRYRVTGVFDDRNQVVRMWRALGLTVFQVAEGDF
jgi:predicted kinase